MLPGDHPIPFMKLLLLQVGLCLACLAWVAPASAQATGYKEHLRLAERFLALGERLKAAEQYAGAYTARPKKTEYAYAAAEQFFLMKDYARAAEYYAPIIRSSKDYPLAGLQYARSLKQAGRFEEATAAYKDYLSYYKGDDLKILRGIVEQEVRGAAMARQALRDFNPDVIVEPFGPSINEPSNEVAPMPLTAETIYFLSDRRGPMRMYRSFESAGKWQPAEAADQFPIVTGRHIGPGALSPLKDRFYFSLCGDDELITQPTASCKIYVIQRSAGAWSTPQPLPSYINTDGNSTSHPYVYRDGEMEVMLFASDRLDGYGGMDLYRSERYLNSGALDFSFPQNLGPVVNGIGDEVGPYYNPETQTLFFASNGYINMGGYDLFSTQGGRAGWNVPVNMGAPINSPADDYYYRELPGTKNATLSSNRALPNAKSRTNNEDLYLVRPGTPTMALSLQVVDSVTQIGLQDALVAAFAVGDGEDRLVTTARSADGYFQLALPMGADIRLQVQREGYHAVERRITVPRTQKEGFQLPRVRMRKIVVTLADVQSIERERPGEDVGTLPTRPAGSAPSTPRTPPSAPGPSATATSGTPPVTIPSGSVTLRPEPGPTASTSPLPPRQETAPAPPAKPAPTPVRSVPARVVVPALEYRIQIEARADYDPYHARYRSLEPVGTLSSDYIEGKSLYRVLVGRYATLAEARAALSEVRAVGWGKAFVVRFDSGTYEGMVY